MLNHLSKILFILIMGCATVAPTPILSATLRSSNDKTIALFQACQGSEGYDPKLTDCNPAALLTSAKDTMAKAEVFISTDLKQPMGYDIYLQTAMIYFRVSQRIEEREFIKSEKIARQFFETQKASSGQSLNDARFYLVWFTAETASFQRYISPFSLGLDRQKQLRFVIQEGDTAALTTRGPRATLLRDAIRVLEYLVSKFPEQSRA